MKMSDKRERPAFPLVVDTAFPVIMHVCRESRAFVLDGASSHSPIKFRLSVQAGCKVPYRHFRPSIDTLFWARTCKDSIFTQTLRNERLKEALSSVVHLALEADSTCSGLRLLYMIDRSLPRLESLSVVFTCSSNNVIDVSTFQAPGRRCKLKQFPSQSAKGLWKVHSPRGFHTDSEGYVPLENFLDEVRTHLLSQSGTSVDDGAWFGGSPYSGTMWNRDTQSFQPLEYRTEIFVEYSPEGEWLEGSSARRRWLPGEMGTSRTGLHTWEENEAHKPRYIPIEQRRHPEEYRVNDDDAAFHKAGAALVRLSLYLLEGLLELTQRP